MKEIEETKMMEHKVIDNLAIHKNEDTGEMEGEYECAINHRQVSSGVAYKYNNHRVHN